MEFQDSDKWFQLFCELCIKHNFKYKIGRIDNPDCFKNNTPNCYVEFGGYRVESLGEMHLWQLAVVRFLNSPADSGGRGE